VREIMALTDKANFYIDQQKPWLLAKDPARLPRCRRSARRASTCSACSRST
jgi:methionyl-tRNA synthetase